jgi:pyridoxine 4-dehydrogenase
MATVLRVLVRHQLDAPGSLTHMNTPGEPFRRSQGLKLIREALHPYPDDLVIVTKIGARRGADGSWLAAFSPEELTQAVEDNLRHLGLEVLDVVNLRSLFDVHRPAEGSIEAALGVLAEL